MTRHCAAHVVAYGYTIFVPKHHFMLHIPEQLARFAFLIACFVHERKHKIAKRWAVPLCIAKKRSYDRTVLEECTHAHMYSLKEPLLKPCLPGAVKASPSMVAALRACGFATAESALTGQTARVEGRSIRVGDVVLYIKATATTTLELEKCFSMRCSGANCSFACRIGLRGEKRHTGEKLS